MDSTDLKAIKITNLIRRIREKQKKISKGLIKIYVEKNYKFKDKQEMNQLINNTIKQANQIFEAKEIFYKEEGEKILNEHFEFLDKILSYQKLANQKRYAVFTVLILFLLAIGWIVYPFYKTKPQHTISYSTTKHVETFEKNNRSICQKVVILHPAAKWAKELGRHETSILASYRINLWSTTTSEGKGRVVGKMIPGSHAKIVNETSEDYKVVSPLDKTIGWINKAQVRGTRYQDSLTREVCIPEK